MRTNVEQMRCQSQALQMRLSRSVPGIRKNIEMIDPMKVTAPTDLLENLNVVYDGGERQDGHPMSGWSMAEFLWDSIPAIGIRWNGEGDGNGMPLGAFGRPLWFVLPWEIGKLAQDALYAHSYREALAVAEVREVEVA
jgi:hypothetical protein